MREGIRFVNVMIWIALQRAKLKNFEKKRLVSSSNNIMQSVLCQRRMNDMDSLAAHTLIVKTCVKFNSIIFQSNRMVVKDKDNNYNLYL